MPHFLTVEISKDNDKLFIHGNPEGLRFLAKRLEVLAASAEKHGRSHEHLMTESWGGNELSEEPQGRAEECRLIHQLSLYA